MDYQKAQNVRSKSFTSLMADKISQGGGIGSSLKATLSEKSQARMTGIKQSLDPMNIAKFMTGGSSLAPAIVGKLTGRSKKDMRFFTKGKKSGIDTASKLGNIETGNDFLTTLMSIQQLIEKTHSDEILQKQKENNFKEEQQTEKERRHRELLAALKGKSVESVKTTPTATKIEDDTNILDDMFGIAGVASILGRVASFFAGPVGIALLGVTSVAALFALLAKDKNPEQTNAMITSAMGGPAMEAQAITEAVKNTTDIERRKQNILADRPADKKSYMFWKDGDLQKQYLQQIGFDETTGLTKSEKDQGFTGIDDKGVPIKKEKGTVSSMTPEAQLQSNKTATPVTTEPKTTPVAASMETPTAASVESVPPISQAFNAVQKENLDVSIPVSKPDPATIVNTDVKSVATSTRNRMPIPTVRNMEETFQRMILNSTRVV